MGTMALATTADLFASYVNDDLVSWNDPRSQNREFTIWLKDISVLELNDLSQYLTKERIMNKYYAVKYRRQVERMEPTFNSLSDLLKDFLQRPGGDVNYKRLQRCPTRDDAIDSFKFFVILLSLLVIKFHLRPLRYFNLLWPKKNSEHQMLFNTFCHGFMWCSFASQGLCKYSFGFCIYLPVNQLELTFCRQRSVLHCKRALFLIILFTYLISILINQHVNSALHL